MKSRIKDTLLLIGDAASDRSRLHTIFEDAFYLLEAESVAQSTMLLEQNRECIAAILADIPLDDLRELVEASRPDTPEQIPVLSIIVPAMTGEREERALMLGAADVVLKPYTTLAIQRRIQVLVDLYRNRWHLEKLVQEQNETIRNANQSMVDTLSAIIEHRSTESGNHVLRIRRFTQILLQEVVRCWPEYELTQSQIDMIASASALHDIGKISIPDAILNKPGKLTAEEFDVMKTHTTIGSELISQLSGLGEEAYLRYAYNISLYHHERWDGTGYPEQLSGDRIPICAQVVGLADVFDALTTPRVYKPAYPLVQAFNMILNGECGQFSPKLLECFKRVRQAFFTLAHQYSDGYSPKSDTIQLPLPGPVAQNYPLDAMQLSQLKYQALLHHVGDTVIEMDLDHRLYHLVFNPNPNFMAMLQGTSLEDLSELLLHEGIHPDDIPAMQEAYQTIYHELFQQSLRRVTAACRLYSPAHGQYQPYEITALRINTGNPGQRIILLIFHLVEGALQPTAKKDNTPLHAPALYGMLNSVVRCCSDPLLTISQGIESLLPLLGYTPQEIFRDFHDSLLELIVPEDRQKLLDVLSSHTSGGISETEFRLMRKNRMPVWVQSKIRIYLDERGADCYYLTMTDISTLKTQQQATEDALLRYRTLICQSNTIHFEWDLNADSVSCSENWQTRFGYPPVGTAFSKRLDGANHFHPDDLPLLREMAAALRSGKTVSTVDVRIANNDGRYLWNRIRSAMLPDGDGKPAYIIGLIYDIHELKSAALSMKQQAERDGLTKLLNKTSAQQAVANYLEAKDPDTKAALLVLDMDNFKAVNDVHGHLYGDAVLAQVGTTLRSLFRSQDVLGRIGGDEFLILLKDVPGRTIVEERCQLLVQTLRDQLQLLMPGLNVSISIGCALIPNHGAAFADLFRHADEALYQAKREGKNRYSIYDRRRKYSELTDPETHITRIDSEGAPMLQDDTLVRFVFSSLYESRNLEATINELLAFIGNQFNVSRVYIFENNDDNTTCSNTFEWCNEGISPEKDHLQNVSYITDIPGWPDVYDERGVLYCTDVKDLPENARQILEPQGIKSMLQCAILDKGVFRGYVGFDECTGNRLWTQGQVDLLEYLSQVLAVFLIKQRALEYRESK